MTARIQNGKRLTREARLEVAPDMAKIFLGRFTGVRVLVHVAEGWIAIEQRPFELSNHGTHRRLVTLIDRHPGERVGCVIECDCN